MLALTLNVRFDAIDPTFSASTLALTSLVVADPASSLYGLTVQNVLDLADQVLAGQPSSVPLADLYDAVSRINANFDGGGVDLGFLGMP